MQAKSQIGVILTIRELSQHTSKTTDISIYIGSQTMINYWMKVDAMKKFEQAFIITGVACFEVPADNTPSLDGNE